MILTKRDTPQGVLVSICDGDVLGETFEDGEVSLTVTEDFYGGESVTSEAAVRVLGEATVANIVGVESVQLAIDHGFVDEENVLEIDGTLHAQYLQLD